LAQLLKKQSPVYSVDPNFTTKADIDSGDMQPREDITAAKGAAATAERGCVMRRLQRLVKFNRHRGRDNSRSESIGTQLIR
jgi:hypothetical protein